MNAMHDPIFILERVAAGLEELCTDVVFVGGAAASLYRQNPAAETIRPTDDVDFVVELVTYPEYNLFLDKLIAKGFRHDLHDKNSPICRLLFDSYKVDVMPTGNILGFSNQWYSDGMNQSIKHKLPSGITIRIFSLPYYLASKIEAYYSRGNDFRFSHDIEDCIMVIDGIMNPADLACGKPDVTRYLQEKFRAFLDDERLLRRWSVLFLVMALRKKQNEY